MKIMGISSTSLYDVKHFIQEFKDSLNEQKKSKLVCQFIGFGVEPKDNVFLALVPSMGAFKQVMDKLPKKCRVILFDSPMILENAGITVVDATTKDHLSYQLHTLNYDDFKNHLVKLLNGEYEVDPDVHFKLIPHLLQEVKGSLTQTLLNITMQCRVPEKRRQITYSFLIWLLSGGDISKLEESLTMFGVDEQSIKKMVDWLESDFGKQARKVFIEIRIKQREGKAVNYDSICKGTSVQPFDVKYLLRHIRQLGTISHLNSTSVEEYAKRQKQRLAEQEENEMNQNVEEIDIMSMTLDEFMEYSANNGDQ